MIIVGLALVAIGMILHFAPWLLSWFGKLPFDIRIETERSKIYFPIGSMIVISIVLTLIINIFRR